MEDFQFQNLMPVQSDKQPTPVTMVAAAVVAPTTRLTRFTGTTPITTITPPVTGYHELVFVFTTGTVGHLGTGGNISTAFTSVANKPVTVYYDPRTKLYYPGT